jgi:hypothetical protein
MAKFRYNEFWVAVILRVAKVVAPSMAPRVKQRVPGSGKAQSLKKAVLEPVRALPRGRWEVVRTRDPAQLVEPEPAVRKAAPQAYPL